MSRQAPSPFAARLGAALGLELGAAAALVERLARQAPVWLPWSDEADLGVMFASWGGLPPGTTDAQLAEALVRARIVVRAENSGQFEPTEAFADRIAAESERRVAERDRKRRIAAESARRVPESGGEWPETAGEAPESDRKLPESERKPRAGTRGDSTPPPSPPPPTPGDTTDSRVEWLLWLAAEYGYGKHRVSRALLGWLLELLATDPHAEGDIAVAFAASDGVSNRKRYLEAAIRNRQEQRRRAAPWASDESRAPPECGTDGRLTYLDDYTDRRKP